MKTSTSSLIIPLKNKNSTIKSKSSAKKEASRTRRPFNPKAIKLKWSKNGPLLPIKSMSQTSVWFAPLATWFLKWLSKNLKKEWLSYILRFCQNIEVDPPSTMQLLTDKKTAASVTLKSPRVNLTLVIYFCKNRNLWAKLQNIVKLRRI